MTSKWATRWGLSTNQLWYAWICQLFFFGGGGGKKILLAGSKAWNAQIKLFDILICTFESDIFFKLVQVVDEQLNKRRKSSSPRWARRIARKLSLILQFPRTRARHRRKVALLNRERQAVLADVRLLNSLGRASRSTREPYLVMCLLLFSKLSLTLLATLANFIWRACQAGNGAH